MSHDTPVGPSNPLAPLRTRPWLAEARRKAIHLGFLILPLGLLYEWLPWPRGRMAWELFLGVLTVGAVLIDLLRLHQRRVRRFFSDFLGGMIREHEQFSLLGSTYLLLAGLLAVAVFPQPVAAAAIGFTVLGDAIAALVGKAWGRTRFFKRTIEGGLGGLAACLAWGAFLVMANFLTWPVALAGALVASLVEVLPIPLDDNLGITLTAGYVMKLLGGGA